MKNIKSLFFLALLTTSTPAISVADDSSDVEAINSSMTDEFMTGNTTKLAELYTNNAVMLPPSSEILTSNESIKAYWDELKKAGIKEYSIYPVELKVKGDRAYTSGLWEATRITAEGSTVYLNGNISNVFEKQEDGTWKITVQSWN